MTTHERLPDPETAAALLAELQTAAHRVRAVPVRSGVEDATAYQQIVDQQFFDAADRFLVSEARTVEDAFALACAVRLLLAKVIDGTVTPESVDLYWPMFRYGALLIDRLYEALRALSSEARVSN